MVAKTAMMKDVSVVIMVKPPSIKIVETLYFK
jgi:hypothetical protein